MCQFLVFADTEIPRRQQVLVEMAISTNPKPTIYRNLYENFGPGLDAESLATFVQI